MKKCIRRIGAALVFWLFFAAIELIGNLNSFEPIANAGDGTEVNNGAR